MEEIGLGYKSIIAGLLHHTLTDTEYTKEDIRGMFGEKIEELVDGLGKMERVSRRRIKHRKRPLNKCC